jgi:hypothetical protein
MRGANSSDRQKDSDDHHEPPSDEIYVNSRRVEKGHWGLKRSSKIDAAEKGARFML